LPWKNNNPFVHFPGFIAVAIDSAIRNDALIEIQRIIGDVHELGCIT